MQEHINNSTIKIPRDTIQQIFKNAVDFANNLEPLLSRDKKDFLKEGIESKAIPTPKPLIKDHKQKKNGHFPTGLIIPATNFTATFSKLGYLALKNILDSNNIQYNKYTITQASDLKNELEKLDITVKSVMLASLDTKQFTHL